MVKHMFEQTVADPFPHLDSAQHEAVMHGDGPLLILAGAGTGKTTTLAARVAYTCPKRPHCQARSSSRNACPMPLTAPTCMSAYKP